MPNLSLFDAYLMVDWSAAAVPRRGADSIWLIHRTSERAAPPENLPTRHAARARLLTLLAADQAAGRATLVGFDFPLGYPAGTAGALGVAGPPWRGMWEKLADCLTDDEKNANNRFAVAAALNRQISGAAAPFWGCPTGRHDAHLGPLDPRWADLPPQRLCERRVRGPQPVWKLYGNGSAGGQALTGIPVVHWLRRQLPGSAVWPYETGLAPPRTRGHVFVEIYPSLVPPEQAPGEVKDAGQVRAIAGAFAERDARGELAALFFGDPALSPAERTIVEREEGWVLGVPAMATGRIRQP